ncbi:hypothetical protein HGA91_06165 [candidate division WWE3 bacterium]|nr:hypothetical protein [candidate division WWE3 bacterium]
MLMMTGKMKKYLLVGSVLLLSIGIIMFIAINLRQYNGLDRSNNASQSNSSDIPISENSALPVLQHLGDISLEPFDRSTQTSGSIAFTRDALLSNHRSEMLISPFGESICDEQGVCTFSPGLEFDGVALDTYVYSPVAGSVESIYSNGPDVSVRIIPTGAEGYFVGFDHLFEPRIKVGDGVDATTMLGSVAPYDSGRYGRTTIWVKKRSNNSNSDDSYLCPTSLLADSNKSEEINQLTSFFTHWNDFNNTLVYDSQNMIESGCFKDIVLESETIH